MLELTVALLLFLLPLAYSPGPGNMVFAAIGGRFGLRASIPASTGYHLATFGITAAVGLGFSVVAGWNPFVFDILRYGGAAYVLWLAYVLMRAGAVTEGVEPRPASALDGAVLLVLNPKANLIIALMFTQFLAAGSDPARVLWITAIFTINNLVAFTLWTVMGDVLMRRFRSDAAARPMNIGFGLMLAAVAVWMLLR